MANRFDDQDMRKRVSLYFDKAMSKEDETAFLSDKDQDPHFVQLFNQEKTAREFIKNQVRRPSVSPDLIQNIRNICR